MKKRGVFFVFGAFLSLAATLPVFGQGPKTGVVDIATWERELASMPVKAVLFPIRQAVLSAEVDSQVLSYSFKEGEKIEKGNLLVTLNASSYEQRLEKAKSAVVEAEAGLTHAQKALERNKDMYDKGILGLQELERSELEVEVNQSKVAFNKANLKMAEIDYAGCKVMAPFSGRIVRKLVQDFEFVRYGTQLVSVIDDRRILAVMHLPSADKQSLKIGQEAKIKIDETGNVHLGKVYEISAEADPASRTFEVKVVLDNADGELSSGWSGQLVKDSPAKKAE
jgi:RND family efflux transporter MFP subunit